MEENNKARIRIYLNGTSKPSMSIQEFNQLKSTFQPYFGKLKIGDSITAEGEVFKLISISTEVLDETMDLHVGVGVETTKVGTAFPYNFEVEYFF